MDKRTKEGFARLFVGLALNIPLYLFLVRRLVLWSGMDGEVRQSFIAGSLAVATVVCVTPVFWRGAQWQAPLAFVLIFFLPGFTIFAVVSTILQYR